MIARRMFVAGAFLCLALPAFAQAPTRIRGTIASIDGAVMHVTAKDGADITLALAPTASVTLVVPSTLA